MADKAHAGAEGFFDLSGELRNVIYRYTLIAEDGPSNAALLATSKQVFFEAEPILFKERIFQVTVDLRGCHVDGKELRDWRKMETWPPYLRKAHHVAFKATMDDCMCAEWHAESGFYAMGKFLERSHSLRTLSVEFRRSVDDFGNDRYPMTMICPRWLFHQQDVEVTIVGTEDVPQVEFIRGPRIAAAENRPHSLEDAHACLRRAVQDFTFWMIVSMGPRPHNTEYRPRGFENQLTVTELCTQYDAIDPEIHSQDVNAELRLAAMLYEWKLHSDRTAASSPAQPAWDRGWRIDFYTVLKYAFAAISLGRQSGLAEWRDPPMADLMFLTRS
ncbi:uncharacterized protein K489DRAFT_71530 [Dissoconium aciculare CBS 342.82]|uniref:Uncharacterized protein n=1 Tax=Dissoconium aciculare CBS 342.82 TaxID=1314786 RepID=A0A6J3LYE3_9PEZI|nr:uncharacterized protein K489DRAFT_71530 [Dissoconium aciculare CBS 342.82]KAF1819642.1 hypothetical protein K489DRAFT_71530 [Dissoconium aciculare CBS 342.82]